MERRVFSSVILCALVLTAPAYAQTTFGDLVNLGIKVLGQEQVVRQPSSTNAGPRTPSAAKANVARAQRLLDDLGYDAGPVDGDMGPRTRRAIVNFQRDAGMAQTGQVSNDLVAALEQASSPRSAAAPASTATSQFTILNDTDLPNGDYRSGLKDPALKGIGVAQCQAYCAQDGRCGSFTFNTKYKVCFLKQGTPAQEAFAGAISGIKQSSGGGQMAATATLPSAANASTGASGAIVDAAQANAGYQPTYADFVNMALMSDRQSYLDEAPSTGAAYFLATSSGEECRQNRAVIQGGASEFAHQDFLNTVEARIRDVFSSLDGKPRRLFVPIEAEYDLGPYNKARHGYPVKVSYSSHDPILEPGIVALPGGARAPECFATYGYTLKNSGNPNMFLDLGAEHAGAAVAQFLPMSEADARVFELSGGKRVLLKATLQVEPRDQGRGPLKGKIVSVAAYNADTGALLHVFDLSTGSGTTAIASGGQPLTYGVLSVLVLPVAEPDLDQARIDDAISNYLRNLQQSINAGNPPPGFPLDEADIRDQPPEFVARYYRQQLRAALKTSSIALPITVVAEQEVYPHYDESYGIRLDDFVGHDWVGYTETSVADQLSNLSLSSRDLPLYSHLSFMTARPGMYDDGLDFKQAMTVALVDAPVLELDKLMRVQPFQMDLKAAADHGLFTQGSSSIPVIARWQLELDQVRMEQGHPIISAKLKKLSFRWENTGEPLAEIDVAALPTVAGLRAEAAGTAPKSASDQPIVPPPGGMALNAEAMDLLQLKFMPESATDPFIERMMLSRFAYEKELDGTDQPVSWGRFFLDVSNKLTKERMTELLPRFKAWSMARAAALPAEFIVPLEMFQGHLAGETLLGGNDTVSLDITCDDARRNQSSGEDLSEKDLAALQMCDFLDAAKKIPNDYLFLDGWLSYNSGGTGPRGNCSNDPYCYEIRYARQDLGLAVGSGGSEYGPYDLVHIDKWPVIEDSLRNTDAHRSVNLRIAITGVTSTSEQPRTSWGNALIAAKPFADAHGLDGVYIDDRTELATPALVFSAQTVGADLVDTDTGQQIQHLALAGIGDLPVQMLEQAKSKTAGLDVLGITMGTSFEDADKLVRAHMPVLDVLTASRPDTEVTSGKLSAWSSGRLYISEDKSELIALFDEPPAAADRVLAMWRLVRKPAGSISVASLKEALEHKYGPPIELEPTNASNQEGLKFVWSDHKPTNQCDIIYRYSFDRSDEIGSWVSQSGYPIPAELAQLGVPSWNSGGNYRGVDDVRLNLANMCPPILTVEYAKSDEILTWFFDERSYVSAYYQSLDMAASAPPQADSPGDSQANPETAPLNVDF